MLTFVTWLWEAPAGSTRSFAAEQVNVLQRQLARHCETEHRLVCITDNRKGLHKSVEAMAAPDTGLEHLTSPMRPARRSMRLPPGRRHRRTRPSLALPRATDAGQHFPACYRRLWLFSREAMQLGEWIVQLDIDCIITRSIDPLLRFDANFTGWADPKFGWNKIAGGIWMLRTGTLPAVWEQFDAEKSPQEAKAAGFKGSDQAWLSYQLHPAPSYWTKADGLYKINWMPYGRLSPRARIVFTAGNKPPWSAYCQVRWPWVIDHWR